MGGFAADDRSLFACSRPEFRYPNCLRVDRRQYSNRANPNSDSNDSMRTSQWLCASFDRLDTIGEAYEVDLRMVQNEHL
jgi:hypothetical protein